MKKQRLYIDTSVYGGYYDEEFKEYTVPLFERIDTGEFIILFSTLTQEELIQAPENVQQLVRNLKVSQTGFLVETEDAIDLADKYMAEKVVGRSSYADCLHIALATVNEADILVIGTLNILLTSLVFEDIMR